MATLIKETKPVIEVENLPVPAPLPASGGEKMATFKTWQKLPLAWMPPIPAPPLPDDLRDRGIAE